VVKTSSFKSKRKELKRKHKKRAVREWCERVRGRKLERAGLMSMEGVDFVKLFKKTFNTEHFGFLTTSLDDQYYLLNVFSFLLCI